MIKYINMVKTGKYSVKLLSKEEFLKTFQKVPRVAINLIITDPKGRILLARRNIPPCLGSWHFPGGFLLKNEPIIEAQKRIAKNELGLDIKNSKELPILGVFDDIKGDSRGHVVDVAYALKIQDISTIQINNETLEVKFFEKNNLPSGIGFNHRETLNKLGFK